MDSSPWGLIKTVVPQLPIIIKTFILSILRLSPATGLQETSVEVFTATLRAHLSHRKPLFKTQTASLGNPTVKGRKWIAKCVIPATMISPDAAPQATTNGEIPDVRQALVKAIVQIGDGSETYQMPEVQDIEAEWTGSRTGVDMKASLPDLPEDELYQRLMDDETRTSELTVLYLHGGAYVAMDPMSHRDFLAELCRRTHGRGLSLRYRLAPQNPFPAALLDAFVAYLYLLYPPTGSFHKPVSASSIVISGDSAGGGLSAALVLLLLTLRGMGIFQVRFYGEIVDLPLPGGFALTSPWVDVSRSMPSVYRNAKLDYLGLPSKAPSIAPVPVTFPADEIWPASPPRVDFYCDASMVIHPLVSPVSAKPQLWDEHPPVWISSGSEGLQDEILILTDRLTCTGPTSIAVFEGMPHVFSFMCPWTEWSKDCFKSCADFCAAVVNSDSSLASSATWWSKRNGPRDFDLRGKVEEFVGDEKEIEKRLLVGRQWRLDAESEMVEEWKNTRDKKQKRAKL